MDLQQLRARVRKSARSMRESAQRRARADWDSACDAAGAH
eukprot:gene13282-61511_t